LELTARHIGKAMKIPIETGSWDPGEPKRTFIYKPETGELVVIFDPDGPGGQPPREVYRGDPNGYHWHHRPR
jgi:hypothetical protein